MFGRPVNHPYRYPLVRPGVMPPVVQRRAPQRVLPPIMYPYRHVPLRTWFIGTWIKQKSRFSVLGHREQDWEDGEFPISWCW